MTENTQRPSKRSKPAVSAKILATGLSTTAMLGMTAGYAAANNAQHTPVNPPTGFANSGVTGVQASQGAATQIQTQTQPQTQSGVPALGPLVPTNQSASKTPAPTATTGVVAPQAATPTPDVAAVPAVTAAPQVIEIPVAPPAPADPGNGGGGWNNQPSSGSN